MEWKEKIREGDEERHIHKHAERVKQRDAEKKEIDSEIESETQRQGDTETDHPTAYTEFIQSLTYIKTCLSLSCSNRDTMPQHSLVVSPKVHYIIVLGMYLCQVKKYR